jgi:hypothetical protein
MGNLGRAYCHAKQGEKAAPLLREYAQAEPLLVKGYEGMKAREKTIPPQGKQRLAEALQRLVQLYEGLDIKAEAAKWRKKLESMDQ